MTDATTLLTMHASLPEPRQPAWGLGRGDGAARRACDDRVAAVLPLLLALPCADALRILDLECAQGYFTLAVAQALAARGRTVEVVGVDRREENIRFCTALAAHHGIPARFACATFDTEFVRQQETSRWDAILAFGARRSIDDAEAALENTAALLLAHSRVTLCELAEGQRSSEAAVACRALGDCLVAAHAFSRRLASFAALGGEMRGLHACSGHLAWVGERWFAFDRVTDRSHAGISDSFAGQRRFFLGAQAVVKAVRGDGRHARFNRAELAAEAEVLRSLPSEPARYPAVLAQADDGDVVWLVREALPGELLSERIAAGGVDHDAVACGLLAELAHLQAQGFHHGDLRCWNVLAADDEVRLIDFGAMTRTSSPLQRLALAAMLLELAGDQVGHEQPFYACVHPVAAYPSAWQPLVRYLLGTPQAAFSYAEAQRILATSLRRPTAEPAEGSVNLEPDGELLSAAVREHCEAFQRLRQHGEAVERSLAGEEHARAARLAEASGLRAHARELEQAHKEYVESLKAEIENSHAYATSLKATLDRERADARIALEAMEAARRVAADYAESLAKALNESKREVAQLVWMRHRFRWLKPFWPRQPDTPKEPE